MKKIVVVLLIILGLAGMIGGAIALVQKTYLKVLKPMDGLSICIIMLMGAFFLLLGVVIYKFMPDKAPNGTPISQ